ncbi:MAG: lipid biosynthesis B12-binding/radical SAM protein [Holophaga sp.]
MSRILLVSSNITTDPFPVYPLGMAVVASALAGAGHTVDQFDFLMAGESEEAFRDRITTFAPDFVCMSLRNLDNCDSLTATAYPVVAKRLVEVVRETRPVPVIIGGSAFSILPEELLAFTGADYGVVGEGERLVCQLVADLAEGRTSVRILRNEGLLTGPEMISPLFSSELVEYYLKHSGMINLQTKRGCAHGCIYCSYPSLEGNRYRLRAPAEVVDDMERAKLKHGADSYFFTDAVFNDDGGHYLAVVEEMLRRETSFRWCCYVRPEGIGRTEIALMKRAGMYAAELGTDAACDRTLRGLGKGFTFADALAVNRAFVAERVPCAHFVMFGGPGETLETVAEGLANLEQLENTVVFAFTGLRILPDTPLHTLAVREGVLAQDTPLHKPAFYHSPLVDKESMNAMILDAFQGRRDRFFPPEASNRVRSTMLRFGYRGLLWDSLVQFPKTPATPSV